ncbi:hypothetical protein [Devosia sp. 2618]|uniref:hypothetical protein n=1 Tax=Devosia sp. 2618 TaxID=3156454 RepID=UPI003392D553
MKLAYLPIALIILTSPAHAALSGFYDSGEQIGTILADANVADALRQAPIGAITNSGTRSDGAMEWEIRTQECDLIVYLKSVPPQGVGKTTYEVEIGNSCE